MKKYLLLFLMCVYASIGAWANVAYPYNFGAGSSVDYNSTTGVMTVTIATTGDFQTFVDKLAYSSGGETIDLNKVGNLRIICTNNATISSTEVTNLKNKRDNFSLLDLTDAAFDADATISSLITVNYLAYVSLPQGKDISDVTLKDDSSIKGVVTSNGSSAIYTAYNGAADYNFSKLLIGSSLQNVGTWTITNGAASGYITAGAETGNILTAIVSNSTATTLNITLDGITNSPTTLAPSSSITNLTISGIQYPNQYENLTINSGSALTTLTLEDTTIPGSLTIDGCPELVTADLRGVRKKSNGGSTQLSVTVNDDPKLSNLILYKSSTETIYTASGTTPSGLTVTYALPAIPIEYDDCKVTINRDFATGTMTSLISEAKTHLGSTDICTLKVTGELSTTDLESLDDANATRIDLSEATLATGAAITSLQVTSDLESLVLPPNQTVKGTALATRLSTTNCPNLLYAYSPSSDGTATGPNQADATNTSTYSYDDTNNTIADYVWVNQAGGLKQAFENEEQLRNSFYIKVASDVALTQTDVDFNGCTNKPTNYLFLDFSESNLTPSVAASYTVTDNIGYRIILPNGWSGNQMAVFAANPNCGNLAAVYSYDGTTLKIMEIVDASYSQAALANPRIMRSTTTEVDIVSGYHNGQTYAQFGTNLLAALNNMGNSTNYPNSAGLNVRTICIETASAAPNTLTFDNPVITTLNVKGLVQANADLNVNACSALTTLDLTSSSIKSVTANNTHITSADFTSTAISGATDFSGATALATLTTTDETTFNGALNLSQTAFTSFTSAARHGGDISFNQCPNLASINVTAADFANTTSKIHIDANAENVENTTILSTLTTDNCIQIPSTFDKSRLHPTPADRLVEQAQAVADAVTYTQTDMTFHDNNTNDAYYPTYRYWYQGTTDNEGIATLGTSSDRRLATIISNNATLTNNSHAKIKIVGPLTSEDIDALDDLNCTMLDISEATIETGLLKTKLTAGDILNANTKFLVLPDSCSREHIVNGTTLANLANVYSVIAVQNTEDGRDLTSWSRVAGALQPAVVGALNNDANSWSLTPSEQAARKIYTSSVSNFKALKISGCINSYDLSKADQKLDAGGHLSWAENAVEAVSQTRTQNGAYTVYGPFSACFLLTEIDLKNAYFEPWSNQQTGEGYFTRYWVSDMTLSALNVISTATYKVVIPQDSRVNEVPADFLRCSTNIRAICIPSNIRVIRTRAFYTIDYVWTTSASGLGMEGSDPEGSNTRLDNGASLSVDGGTTFVETSALVYNKQTHKYEENPAFLDSYYTANYGTENGGGTYTFGSNLRLIETGAFANTQPNVKDVYVLNTTAPECHVDAFNTVMYTGNGGYNSAKVDSEGIITRDAYYNGRWITMLHYPRQTTTPNVQRYTDPTREYSIATGERDGKGAILYFPNQSEFIRAYQQGTFGYTWNAWNPTRDNGAVANGSFNGSTNEWTAELQTAANALFDAYTTGGGNHQYTSFYKVSDFGTSDGVTAPTATLVPYYNVNWSGSAYTTGDGNLYPKSEKDNGTDIDGSGEMTTKDYRGWHQFVLNAYAANTVLEEEPYRSYITDNEWWTICPEFDITRSEAALLFGKLPGVQVSSGSPAEYPRIHKLRYVRREYSGETIYLSFTKDLATYREERANETANRKGVFTRTDGETGEITAYKNADQHGTADSYGVVSLNANEPAGDDVVMSAGVPYLIKPNLPANGQRQYRIFKSTLDANNYNNNKAANDPIGYGSETLWAKIKFAQEMGGEAQKLMVKNGTYTVPVFVSVADGTNVVKEEVEKDNGTPKKFRPDDDVTSAVDYYKSADRHYTFVGTLYKSFLPHYSYFLGWDSSLNNGNGGAKFYYHNGNFETIDHEMRWANGTGVIVPVLAEDLSEGKFKYDVKEATDMANPAQWDLLTKFADDSFKHTGGGTAKQYVMDFNAPDMIADDDSEVTGIANVDATDNVVINGSADVYTVNGQKVGTSLEGLPKGIYIVNGKKFIVK